MLPEVEKFLAAYSSRDPLTKEEAKEAIDAAYAVFQEAITGDNPDIYDEMRKFQSSTYEITNGGRSARRAVAWLDLAKSDDPIAKYLATKVDKGAYADHIISLLRILPASLEEMDELAVRENWCGEYDTLVRRAQRKGVLPQDNASMDTPARKELSEWVTNNIGSSRRTTRTLFTLVDKVAAEAVEAATKTADSEDAVKADFS